MNPGDKGMTRASRRYFLFARRAALLAILAIVLPILWYSANYAYQVIRTDRESDVLAPVETLIESFYLVAHTSDHADPAFKYPIWKWRSPVAVHLHPSLTDWHRRISERTISNLTKYAGLRIRMTNHYDPNAGLSVFYAKDGTPITDMAREFRLPSDRLRQATCFATYETKDHGVITWGHAVFRRPEEERRTEACILEELVQVLGLPADRATYFPTVFTNDRARPVQFSINDKILLRALYDPAIEPGMSLEQTRKLIPDIIRRLVTGVKARGEQALHQN